MFIKTFLNWLSHFLQIFILRDSKTYSIVLNDPQTILIFFAYEYSKNAKIIRWFLTRWNNWKQVHLEKVIGRKLWQISIRE
jgi:hypothetical protein